MGLDMPQIYCGGIHVMDEMMSGEQNTSLICEEEREIEVSRRNLRLHFNCKGRLPAS